MAENIIIEITADAQKLTPVIDQLVKLGQVSAKDAEEFKKIAAASQTVTEQTVKTTEAVKQSATVTAQASATKQAALQKEIDRLKELETLSKKAADPTSAKRFSDAIKESENRIKSLNTELSKTPKAVSQTDIAAKSLREQFRLAQFQVVQMNEKFGEFSPQAIAAAKAAGELREKISDVNDRINALNPDAKFNAFIKLGTGISGAFTAAQGAMALFGDQSEDVQKALLKVQGALALTQGLNSVLQLKDAFKDLRILLGAAAIAQNGLTAATAEGAVATNTATVASKGFIATLTGSPLLPIILALGAITALYIGITKSTNDAEESQEAYNKRLEETNKKLDETIAKQRELIESVNRGLSLDASEISGRLAEGIDISTVATKDLTEALSELKQQLDDISPAKTLIFDPDELLTADQLAKKQKEVSDLQRARVESDIAAIEKILKSREKEVKSVERLKEKIEELQKIGIDLSAFDKDTRAIIKLFDEFGTAVQNGANSLNDFKLKVAELSEGLGKIPDKLDASGREINDAFTHIESQGTLTFKNILGSEIAFTDEGLAALNDFAEQGKEMFIDLFSTFAAGSQANINDLNAAKELTLSSFDEQLRGLEELNQNKIISDGAYLQQKKQLEAERAQAEIAANKKIGEEKRKAFIADRIATLSRIAIQTAENAVKLFAQTIPPGILSAIAVAFGSLQTGLVLSQPIPKFRHGVIGLDGPGTSTSDSIPAMLSKGESVMTADETKIFKPTLNAIRQNLIPAHVLNNFVTSEGKGGIAVIDSKDMSDLKRIGKRNPAREADMIGKSVAKHLNKNTIYSPLRGEYVN